MNADLLLGRTNRRTMLKAGGALGLGHGLAGQHLSSVIAQDATLVYPSWMLGEAGVGDYWMASIAEFEEPPGGHAEHDPDSL